MKQGSVISVALLIIACDEQALEIVTGQAENGVYVPGTQLPRPLELLARGSVFFAPKTNEGVKFVIPDRVKRAQACR